MHHAWRPSRTIVHIWINTVIQGLNILIPTFVIYKYNINGWSLHKNFIYCKLQITAVMKKTQRVLAGNRVDGLIQHCTHLDFIPLVSTRGTRSRKVIVVTSYISFDSWEGKLDGVEVRWKCRKEFQPHSPERYELSWHKGQWQTNLSSISARISGALWIRQLSMTITEFGAGYGCR